LGREQEMELVTLITPTGGRSECFALCQKFMLRQTITNPIQWIVVKDTDEALELTTFDKRFDIQIHQGSKPWRPGINTQRPNLDEAIKHVKGQYVFVIEDDDWYAPKYLETQLYFLQRFDIVGQGNSHYYNVKERKYKEWKNYGHTSLNETGMRVSELDTLDRAINSGQLYFDMALWERVHNEKRNYLLYDHIDLVIGMKGMPGKQGIGGGHFPDETFRTDKLFEVLRSWVGPEDTKIYIDMMMRNHAIHTP